MWSYRWNENRHIPHICTTSQPFKLMWTENGSFCSMHIHSSINCICFDSNQCIICFLTMDLLSQTRNAHNNSNIVVEPAPLRNFNSNGKSCPFLAIALYSNIVYNAPTHTQGIQQHQKLVSGINVLTNISNNYNSYPNNDSICSSKASNLKNDSCYIILLAISMNWI